MITSAVEVLIYAAALEVYRKINLGEARYMSAKTVNAVLLVVDWQARPSALEK